jgi:hypothetical protein
MKKSSLLVASLIALSAAVVTPVAMAVPGNTSVRLDCPDITRGGSEVVTNYGTYLSGPGIERVGANASTFPLFSGVIQAGSNIPLNLKMAGYHHSGTSYNSNSGVVTCSYASTLGFSPFSITKQLNNGFGGIVTKSTGDEINIMLSVGMKKA